MNTPPATVSTLIHSDTRPLSVRTITEQNDTYRGSGGVSRKNRAHGYRPAFLDQRTGIAYPSRFANGSSAPLHILDGLPDALVRQRDPRGKVTSVRAGIIAGFLRNGIFYTREQAAQALSR